MGLNGLEPWWQRQQPPLFTEQGGIIPSGMIPPREAIQSIQVTSIHIIQGVEGKEGNGMVGPMG